MIDADATLKALAEPRRREILRLVGERELSAGEVAAHFDVSRPAISQHLGVLRDAGLISERREGAKRIYAAVPKRISELGAYLERLSIAAAGGEPGVDEGPQPPDGQSRTP